MKQGTYTGENGNESFMITEFNYEFGNISDTDLEEPNIKGYKVQETNT